MYEHGSKVRLLSEFTAALRQADPMNLGSVHEDEYEPEALSILARFAESGFHLAEDSEDIHPYATGIVAEVMKFWFNSAVEDDSQFLAKWSSLAARLVEIYLAAWPLNDQKNG